MESALLEQILQDEAVVVEHGYTLGAFNRQAHACVVANGLNPQMESVQSGHLQYIKGKGVRKIDECSCSLCVTDGLNDGRWHDPHLMTIPA